MLNNFLSRSKPAKPPITPNMNPDALNTFFSELGPNDSKRIKPVNHCSKYLRSKTYSSMFNQLINPEGLISTVKNLPPKQSYGYSKIPMSVIQRVIHCFAQALTYIFNKSFLTGFFPDALKTEYMSKL